MANKIHFVSNLWAIRWRFQTLLALIIAILVIGAIYLTAESETLLEEKKVDDQRNVGDTFSRCDLFSGKWVFDNTSYPLYLEQDCKFMSDQLACGKFGRKDFKYQFWRWQPNQCDLPRFSATAMLERLRNKRLVFVGDSLNRNQWVSMVCLVETAIPQSLKSINTNGSLISFKASEYNATIEFYWSPLLVESNSDDPVKHRLPERIVRAQSIEKHARFWTNADILVFNTYLWWRRAKMKVLWGSFESPDGVYKEVEMLRSYEMALKTWADWLEICVNPNKTQMFFTSLSPTHERYAYHHSTSDRQWFPICYVNSHHKSSYSDRAEEWGRATDENCYNESEPILKEGYMGSGSDPKMMRLVQETIVGLEKRGLRVQMLNVTQLSEYRKEGHPSVFRKQWELLTEEQISKPTTYSDCIHWCLPGVPDVWNELLYAYIFRYNDSLKLNH